MNYKSLPCKSALNNIKRKYPYGWDLNIYRGCEHGCKYCFAIYSNDYIEEGSYFNTVYYKEGVLKHLENELSSGKWKKEVVNIGGVCDSYQPIEKELQIMPDVLRLFIKYKTPIIISTKSDLILRDIELIKELADITYVNVAFTITTVDEELRKVLEPGGSATTLRFKALQRFRNETNVSTGIHLMPIIPYLTDNFQNLDTIYKMADKIGIHYVLPGTLYLRGKTRPYFMDFAKDYDESKYEKIKQLYLKGGAPVEYKDGLYKLIDELKKKYGVSSSYTNVMKNKMKNQ